MLCVLDSGIQKAAENMARDSSLLKELGKDPILHLYDWEGFAATYGYFVRPEEHLDCAAVEALNLSLARRPTGGGIVFHIWDYAFSFLMPSSHAQFSENPLENYRFVNEIVLEVMQDFLSLGSVDLIPQSFPVLGEGCQNFCMARPTQYDVVYKGLKIAGAAQRKTKRGYLHQGTISLALPDEKFLKEVLLAKEDVAKAMQAYSFAPLGPFLSAEAITPTRLELGRRLEKAFRRHFDFS